MLTPVVETINAIAPMALNQALAPLDLDTHIRRGLRLLDTPGLVGLALSGLDMAFWDAHAKEHNVPLATLLGSSIKTVQCYNSCGLWIQEHSTIAQEARELMALHDFNAIKLRVGRDNPIDDLQAIKIVRQQIGNEVALMVDFNQSQSVASATRRIQMLDDEGLTWIEEPVRHADYKGSATIRAASKTPIQTGENLNSSYELKLAIAGGAADYYMPDVQRIGGVTGWLRAAALCHASEIEMSSHLFPEYSVHLLAATPTCHWLEYVDWANPILKEPLIIQSGFAQVPDKPGVGIEWNEAEISRYLV